MNGYEFLVIRDASEEDGRLYPVMGDAQHPVEPEPGDGTPMRFTAGGLDIMESLPNGMKKIAGLRDVRLDLVLTDARLALSCDKFDKGGGWWGIGGAGAAIALVADGVSKVRAAHRRRGKALLGQVRYPWIRCVGFMPKTGWASDEQLRVGVVSKLADGSTRDLYLDLILPKTVASQAVAEELVSRAARHRLTRTPFREEERAALESLAGRPTLPVPEKGKFALHQMPRYSYVSPDSVDLLPHPTPERT